MNKEALLKLADLLEANANDDKGAKFDLGALAECTNTLDPPALNCHTTVCGMGLAALSGAFPRLTYRIAGSGDSISMLVDGAQITYRDAAMEVFDIDWNTATRLFTPGHGSRPETGAEGERALADALRQLVEASVGGRSIVKKRFVVSATIDGEEVARKAVWAEGIRDIMKMDLFSDDEFARLAESVADRRVTVSIKADCEEVTDG